VIILYRYLLHPLFSVALRLAALRSAKIREGLRGRRLWRRQIERAISGDAPGGFRLHVHAASVGEFEQAKPVIEAVRAQCPDARITASFFSPSGYAQQGAYESIDGACYLPPDRPGPMGAFLDVLRPDLILVVRYDLWPEMLLAARRRGVPVALICGVLRSDSARFNPFVRPFFRRLYGDLSLICSVGREDREAFESLAPGVPVDVCGDSRFDRVVGRAAAAPSIDGPIWSAVRRHPLVVVAGSTWPPDEEMLSVLNDDERIAVVIVPHEPTPDHVEAARRRFPGARAYSELEGEEGGRFVILDRTGMLAGLYRLADLAYVGGGFGAGVHSVLEPAVFGIPVVCGPRIERSRDAEAMRRAGMLHVVGRPAELRAFVSTLVDDPERRRALGDATRSFVLERSGAVERIRSALRKHGLLRNPSPKSLSLPVASKGVR
jgi:3-deoxy-D-manno-octulosonic-acid transferase